MTPYTCATVAIKGKPTEGNPSGIVVINESDFDESTMTKVELSETPAPEALVDPVAEVPAAPKVVAPWAAS